MRKTGSTASIFGVVQSPATDAVIAAHHPAPCDGGPCATCAFRPGTEANLTEHTITLARLCVEGGRMFSCHERPGLCRGFVAAINLRGVTEDEEAKRWSIIAGEAADILSRCIDAAKAVDDGAREAVARP